MALIIISWGIIVVSICIWSIISIIMAYKRYRENPDDNKTEIGKSSRQAFRMIMAVSLVYLLVLILFYR